MILTPALFVYWKEIILGKDVFIVQNIILVDILCEQSQNLRLLTKKISLNFGKSPGKLLENSWNLITGLVHEPCRYMVTHRTWNGLWPLFTSNLERGIHSLSLLDFSAVILSIANLDITHPIWQTTSAHSATGLICFFRLRSGITSLFWKKSRQEPYFNMFLDMKYHIKSLKKTSVPS